MPSKKKKYNARFPAGRIKKIMQTDEEVGKVAQAVPVIISRTLELFVESLLTKSLQVTQSRNAKTLSPSHLKQCILAESRFDFLRDMVKNIPDVSQAEEKEAAHNKSGESSPTASRFPESKPRQTRPTASSHNNGQSSDSGSDYEPVNKRTKSLHGNGRNIRQYPNRQTDKQNAVPLTIPKLEIILPSVQPSAPLIITSAASVSQPAAPRPSRLPNFYQETLKEDDDSDKKETPVYSSVIQPNPEYSRSAGFYKQTEEVNVTRSSYLNAGFKDTIGVHSEIKILEPTVPRLHIDLSRGFRDNTKTTTTKTPTTPMFHLDLSSMPMTPQTERNNQPFTPTLIRQPHTPIFKDSGIFKTGLQRSESLNQFGSAKKGPPPALQTLKRTTSLYDSPHSPHLRNSTAAASNLNEVEDLSVPKIKIDITTDGQNPKFHLDLSNYKFESDRNVPSPSTIVAKKRKGHVSNEPPPLLPINPVLKSAPATLTSNTFRKGSSLDMQLDEDYDT